MKKLEAWLAKRAGAGKLRQLRRLRRAALLSAARPAAAAGELRRIRAAAPRTSKQREKLRSDLIALFDHDFTELRARVLRLENGPPVGYPVQFRVSGEDIATVRELARKAADVVRQNPNVRNVQPGLGRAVARSCAWRSTRNARACSA